MFLLKIHPGNPIAPTCDQVIQVIHAAPVEGPKHMDYTDFLSISLTATTVILAVIALAIGFIAFWGYSQFESMTRKASRVHLEDLLKAGNTPEGIKQLLNDYLTRELQSGELRKIIADRIDLALLRDAGARAKDTVTEDVGNESEFKD